MAKICITGGAGFIAYHLTAKLWNEGHTVVSFDNFNDYYDPSLKRDRADILLKSFGVDVREVDLCDRLKLIDFMQDNKPDVVVHLAAYAGVRHSLDYPDGPWGRPDMALFDFTNNIVKGNPIELFNYGDMVRDFTYVDDIVAGIYVVIDRITMHHDINEIYNIGYGDQVQLVDFVDSIEKHLGREAIRELVPMHPADTLATWSDTSKL